MAGPKRGGRAPEGTPTPVPGSSGPARSGDKLVVGRIGAPRGLRGDLKVHSYSGDFDHLRSLKEVELVPGAEAGLPRWERPGLGEAPFAGRPPAPGPGSLGPSGRPSVPSAGPAGAPNPAASVPAAPRRASLKLKVLRSELGPGGFTMAFAGYETPESARVLTGMDIQVPRELASPLEENQYYVADLVGLELVLGPGIDGSGKTAGLGPGAAVGRVEAVLDGGPDPWLETRLSGGEKVLVPFRKEFVGEVDLAAGKVELLAPWILE